MEAGYLTDDEGNPLGILLDIKEYERLLEMEDIRRYNEAVAAHERGEGDTSPWEQVRDHIGSEYGKHTD